MSASLKGRVVSGILWSTAARVGQQVVQFGLSVILARLLMPDDFGSIGMILVFTTFMGIFADTGFGSALVQRSDITEYHIQSVFWFNVVTGVLLSGIMYLGAPFVAAFYRVPILLHLTRGLAPVFILSTAGVVPAALLQRRMQFNRLAQTSIVATFVSGVLGVTLALLGAGVWSLVAQSLSSYMSIVALNWFFSAWRPRPMFNWNALRELWGYASNLLGFNLINYWARNTDNILVGKFFGPAALGYYARAYGFMLLPTSQIVSVITDVMFPAMSSIKGDRARVRGIYLRAIGVISFLTFPIMGGLLVVAEPLVLAVYGAKWAAMIPLLRILVLVGAVQSLVSSTGWLYLSQGRTDWLFRWGVVRSSILVAAIVLGTLLGSVEWVAVCYAVANLLLLYPDTMIPGRLVDMGAHHLFRAVSGPLAASAIMVMLVYVLSLWLPPGVQNWLALILLTTVGVLAYGGLVVSLRLPAWLEFSTLVREWLSRRAQSVA